MDQKALAEERETILSELENFERKIVSTGGLQRGSS